MDDLGWSWPAWKFGLKRDDLFTSLHDKYNTFTFSLQDPEAFHADVYEVAHDADTTEQFYSLMAERRQQRLRELHESLESLAVEIIANPKLMDSGHWDDAIQLFRTKSFDSLVRYFASYLPDGYLSRHDRGNLSAGSSFSDTSSVETLSTAASSVDDAPSKHSSFLNGPVMTEEPQTLDAERDHVPAVDAPLSPPESETMPSQGSSCSEADLLESQGCSSAPRSRTVSFSGSESEAAFGDQFRRPVIHDDDDTSQSDSVDSVDSCSSDCGESRSSLDTVDDKRQDPLVSEDEEDALLTAQLPEDAFDVFDQMNDAAAIAADVVEGTESDTPTPRPEGASTASYIDYKAVLCRRLSPPPSRQPFSPKQRRYSVTPPRDTRRSPDEAHSKIQKPQPDAIRRRARGMM